MALTKKFLGLDLATKTGWAHSDGVGGVLNLANKEKHRGKMAARFDEEIRTILKEKIRQSCSLRATSSWVDG